METYDPSMAPRFRVTLLQRAALLAHVIAQEHQRALETTAAAHDVADFKDVAAQDSIAGVDEVHAAHAATEIAQVRCALARIDDGSYGMCLDCGDPIDLRRLQAVPAASLCTA